MVPIEEMERFNPWCNKGVALVKPGKNIWATRAFDKAIALNPGDGQARHYRDLAQKENYGVL
jgi:hypothetical protein